MWTNNEVARLERIYKARVWWGVLFGAGLGILASSIFHSSAQAATPEDGWATAKYPATETRRESRVDSSYQQMAPGFWRASGLYYEFNSGAIYNPRTFLGSCFGSDLEAALCFVTWGDRTTAWTFPADRMVLDSAHIAGRVVSEQDFGILASAGGADGRDGVDGRDGRDGADGADGDPGFSPRIQFSASSSGPWSSTASQDKPWIRIETASGQWTTPVRFIGQDGDGSSSGDGGTQVPGLSSSPQSEQGQPGGDGGDVLLAEQNTACNAPTTGLWRYADAEWEWCEQSETWQVSWHNSACDIYADYAWASNRGVPWCYMRTADIQAEIGEYGWTSGNKLNIGGRTRFSRNETVCRAWHRDPESSSSWDVCMSGDNRFIVSTAAYLGQFEWQTITSSALLASISVSAANACNGAVGRQATLCALAPEADFYGRGGSHNVYNGSQAFHPYNLTATSAKVGSVDCPIGSKARYLVDGNGSLHNAYLVVVFASPCSGASSFNTIVTEA